MLIYLQMTDSDENRDKFAQIYERYKGLMFHIAMSIFHSREDAEDVVHQAFLKIIDNLDKLAEADSPAARAYIVSICKTVSIDLLRKRRREVSVETIDETDLPQYTAEDALSDAFRRLKPQYRELLLLRYHLGYGTAEIARSLDLNYETVRKRLQYAKRALQELLDEGGEQDA